MESAAAIPDVTTTPRHVCGCPVSGSDRPVQQHTDGCIEATAKEIRRLAALLEMQSLAMRGARTFDTWKEIRTVRDFYAAQVRELARRLP